MYNNNEPLFQVGKLYKIQSPSKSSTAIPSFISTEETDRIMITYKTTGFHNKMPMFDLFYSENGLTIMIVESIRKEIVDGQHSNYELLHQLKYRIFYKVLDSKLRMHWVGEKYLDVF